jgi:hypothetical protein
MAAQGFFKPGKDLEEGQTGWADAIKKACRRTGSIHGDPVRPKETIWEFGHGL